MDASMGPGRFVKDVPIGTIAAAYILQFFA